MMKLIQRRVFVSGRVQGVGFRKAILREVVARSDGVLKGYVQNLSDGRVEAVFCGQDSLVLEMVAWCRKGPLLARVSELHVLEENPDPALTSFCVNDRD